jgi:hypothetical protein
MGCASIACESVKGSFPPEIIFVVDGIVEVGIEG